MTTINDLVAAAIVSAIPPTIAAGYAWREARKVHRQVKVPDRRNHRNSSSKPTTTGEEIADIRQDVYTLGLLFGNHLLFHGDENKAVSMDDLAEPLTRMAEESERRRKRSRDA